MPALLTVRDLRRRWKPHKERLGDHPTHIRFHRACSWLQRAEKIEDKSDLDVALLAQWIAFNSLYGQWDDKDRAPVRDQTCWRLFVERILDFDSEGQIGNVLMDHKPLVLSILEDEYLSRFFWDEPTEKRARQSKKTMFDARTWYIDGNFTLTFDRLIERVYFLRCQLVHGAATFNSDLNRTAIRRCSTLLSHLLPAILSVWIDHGSHEDWGTMCYPPMRNVAVNNRISNRRVSP